MAGKYKCSCLGTLCCSLFKVQARYIVERMDSDLWNKVLDESNQYRRQLVDQVLPSLVSQI